MIELRRHQERCILYALMKHDTYLDQGNGRMVYDIPKEAYQYLPFLDNPENYVIKIAMGMGGIRQNRNEQEVCECYNVPIAEICAFGKFIEIMEKIEPEDYRDLMYDYDCDSDCYMEDYIENYKQRADETAEHFEKRVREVREDVEQACNVIHELNEIFGYTSDNAQLGRTAEGRIVSYDYGFKSDADYEQTSDLSWWLRKALNRIRYLHDLIFYWIKGSDEEIAGYEQKLVDEVW